MKIITINSLSKEIKELYDLVNQQENELFKLQFYSLDLYNLQNEIRNLQKKALKNRIINCNKCSLKIKQEEQELTFKQFEKWKYEHYNCYFNKENNNK